MKIALDYDDTFTLEPALWLNFILAFQLHGHEVRIVTMRSPEHDRTPDIVALERHAPVIYTNGGAKRAHCEQVGWVPDVWIDDNPAAILAPSTTSNEVLAAWRAQREQTI